MKKIIIVLFVVVLAIFGYAIFTSADSKDVLTKKIYCVFNKEKSCYDLGVHFLEDKTYDLNSSIVFFDKSCNLNNPPHPTKSKSLKLIFTSHHKFFA